MAKKIATSFVVEPQTDAEKLTALLTSSAPAPAPEVIPTIPVERTIVETEPTPTPVVPQSLDAAQVLAFLAANPQILQAATASAPRQSVNVSLRPAVTKSTQKKGYVNMAFSEKPSADAIAELKAAKYRWSPFNKVWYGPGDALANHAVYGADVQSALNS